MKKKQINDKDIFMPDTTFFLIEGYLHGIEYQLERIADILEKKLR